MNGELSHYFTTKNAREIIPEPLMLHIHYMEFFGAALNSSVFTVNAVKSQRSNLSIEIKRQSSKSSLEATASFVQLFTRKKTRQRTTQRLYFPLINCFCLLCILISIAPRQQKDLFFHDNCPGAAIKSTIKYALSLSNIESILSAFFQRLSLTDWTKRRSCARLCNSRTFQIVSERNLSAI